MEQRRRSAKKDVAARSRRVFVQMGPGQECRHNGGWIDARASVGGDGGKEGLEKLDSQFIIRQRPTPQPLVVVVRGCSGARTHPSRRCRCICGYASLRAAPRADLGGAYLICSMTSVTRRAGGVAFVGLSFLLQPIRPAKVVCWPRLHSPEATVVQPRACLSQLLGTAALWHGLA
jgi:hypothetical protein